MPLIETVERFISRVESNAHVQAIGEFYAADASMQENQNTPRYGRDKLILNERKVLSRVKSMVSTCIRPVFIQDDKVIIRWIFRFVWHDDSATEMEELAYQRWEGEHIAEETFFYDPGQVAPQPARPITSQVVPNAATIRSPT